MDLFVSASDDDEPSPINYSTSVDVEGVPYKLFEGFPDSLLNFASVCCIVFMFLGIPGNLITIIALARCKKVRNATAVFIINLSCSDLLFCCFNLPLAASTFYHKEWVHGDLMCRLFPLLRYGLLAVSIFTILMITINRYIMIGHQRIYPRIYRRKYLTIMVILTWVCSFGTLVQTWRGKWGQFGLDESISSCSILKAENGSSPKQFLFIMAFLLPCFAIFICYARIFYIVRVTSLKAQEPQLKANGSVRKVQSNNVSNFVADKRKLNNISLPQTNEVPKEINQPTDGSTRRKFLSKNKDEELKFIDTSVESDLPPTLSQLQRKNVQISVDHEVAPSPSSELNAFQQTTSTTINSFREEQLRLISRQINDLSNVANNNHVKSSHGSRKLSDDSIAEDSATISLVQVHDINEQKNDGRNSYVPIAEPSTSSVETPSYDDNEIAKNKPKKLEKTQSHAKIKQKKLNDEPTETKDKSRKKSIANSGASLIYAGRMTPKDRRLLKMILVIFLSFLTCYLPITLTKVMSSIGNIQFFFIMGYLLIYLSACLNPIIYVVMSSEYRQAYKNLLMCRSNNARANMKGTLRESKRRHHDTRN